MRRPSGSVLWKPVRTTILCSSRGLLSTNQPLSALGSGTWARSKA